MPYLEPAFAGGERAALAHLSRYFASDLSKAYKATGNDLFGTVLSSKCSMWLASGAMSVRQLAAEIDRHEIRVGPNEGTEWLRLELHRRALVAQPMLLKVMGKDGPGGR